MATYLVPDEKSVQDKLQFLYGEDLEVASATAPDADKAICGVYVSSDGTPVAAALCDIAFGCYAGASLSMIPAGGAKDAANSGEISQGMMDNLSEVLNMCANLLMDDSTPHLKFDKVYGSLAEAPDAAKTLVAGATGPAFKVDIPRYGSGVLSMMS
ncbi:MAG: hypothetical protein ACI8W7_002091 [Gammaproteobacteria bacterium]|jgi:hypothetical protein